MAFGVWTVGLKGFIPAEGLCFPSIEPLGEVDPGAKAELSWYHCREYLFLQPVAHMVYGTISNNTVISQYSLIN